MNPQVRHFWEQLNRRLAALRPKHLFNRQRNRLLIHEILTLQLIITSSIGILAIASLYWGGQWILQNNYSRWALQWTEELHELGAPLYLTFDDQVSLRLEGYIEKYPEIKRVTYYELNGEELFSIANSPGDTSRPKLGLPSDKLAEAARLVGADQPYIIESSLMNVRAFDIYAPIWTESIFSDGLFDFDLEEAEEAGAMSLIGYVGLELDFSEFHSTLLRNIKIATFILLMLLSISAIGGRLILRRALTVISDLQEPISELAKGNLAVQFKPADHKEIADIVVALETTATALGERDAKLLKLANHDALTGLFNRRRFVDELQHAIDETGTSHQSSALLFIDLDQFKYVNDTCGHPAGDRLIVNVADRLRDSVPKDAVVARFGGDEFAVLVRNVSRQQARLAAEMILEDMRQFAHVEDGRVLHIHCSIGIAMIRSSSTSQEDLLAHADIACREAKACGRNQLRFYKVSAHESEQMVADIGWIGKLREALDNQSFELRYQPIVNIRSGETTHHEVLLRLREPNGKEHMPDAFLPAAERFGLMAEIDIWLISNAIAALAEYRQEDPDLRFSLNLSANAFESDSLAAFAKSQLTKHGVPAECIIFEITESLAIRHLSHVEKEIADLRDMGCEFALDDFGTGYSSFGVLKQLAVDFIKIDGSFISNIVRDPVDQKTVQLISEIAKSAGLQTIAEYVQTRDAMTLLGELGVDYAQGYYVGRPSARPGRKTMPILINTRRRRVARKA
ncbi:MAG: EAL domain-containing protein [Gammaproteobacteria bacterium]|nr:EAL domain-containing protein [Gammaproteobacteria bacterium]